MNLHRVNKEDIEESKKRRKKKDVTKGSFGFFQTLTGGDYERGIEQFNNSVNFGGLSSDGGSSVIEDVDSTVEMSNEYDSEGNPLTKEQVEFFKNSKVRDSKGRLLVCYRRDSEQISEFDKTKSKRGWLGNGFYFSTNKQYIRKYGKYKIDAYLNIRNPYYFDSNDHFSILTELKNKFSLASIPEDTEILELLIDRGYDGMLYTDWDSDVGTLYVAFEPNQIKSITNKTPTNSDNINEDINKLTKEQENFFKNSKIRDKEGNLLVCYHGTQNPGFRKFDPRDAKSQFGEYKFKNYNVNYFTTSEDIATGYTDIGVKEDGNVYACYLNVENPYIVDEDIEDEWRSWKNLKDKKARERFLSNFERFWRKWKWTDELDDYDLDRINKDLYLFNAKLIEDEDFDRYHEYALMSKGNNSLYGKEHKLMQPMTAEEMFDPDNYDDIKDALVGSDEDDYILGTDDIVRYVLTLNEEDGTNYDGIIIPEVIDIGPQGNMFSPRTTDIITLKSSNQIKRIDNLNPTDSEYIDEKYAHHFGDLDVAKKAERRIQQTGGRSTGHFGTGFYMISDLNQNTDYYNKRDLWKIDLDKYKLFKPSSNEEADKLHDALKTLNSYVDFVPHDYDDIMDQLYDIEDRKYENYNRARADLEELLMEEGFDEYNINNILQYFDEDMMGQVEHEVKDILRYKERSFDYFMQAIKDLSDIFGRNVEMEAMDAVTSEDQDDSKSTVFMKSLGYEGVDVTDLKHFDNFKYGSVVYDLKPGTYEKVDMESVKEELTIKKTVKDYFDDCVEKLRIIGYKIDDDIKLVETNKVTSLGSTKTIPDKDGNIEICLDKDLLKGSDETIEDTIYHELAHYLTTKKAIRYGILYQGEDGEWYLSSRSDYKPYNQHGEEWQKIKNYINLRLGTTISTTAKDVNAVTDRYTNNAKYTIECNNCHEKFYYYRRSPFITALINNKADNYQCPNCKKFGNFKLITQ